MKENVTMSNETNGLPKIRSEHYLVDYDPATKVNIENGDNSNKRFGYKITLVSYEDNEETELVVINGLSSSINYVDLIRLNERVYGALYDEMSDAWSDKMTSDQLFHLGLGFESLQEYIDSLDEWNEEYNK